MKNGKYVSGNCVKYYKNGKLHREDGPARVWDHGLYEWWLNGELHCETGPCVYFSNDNRVRVADAYYVHGANLSKQEFLQYKLLKLMK